MPGPYRIGGDTSGVGPLLARIAAEGPGAAYIWDSSPLLAGNHTEYRNDGLLVYAVDWQGNVTVASIISDVIQSTYGSSVTFAADGQVEFLSSYAGSMDEGNGAYVFDTASSYADSDHILVVKNDGVPVFEIHGTGALSLTYGEDLTPGGSGTVSANASGTWTPNSSSTSVLTIEGIPFSSVYAISVTHTIDLMVALIAANPTVSVLVTALNVGGTSMSITANADIGVLGNQFTLASDGLHGASVSGPLLAGGIGENADLDHNASGRIVFGSGQALFSVVSSTVVPKSIISPTVETIGLNLAVGVMPLNGGFLLFNPVPAVAQVAFVIGTQ